jgi:hypothetical protein
MSVAFQRSPCISIRAASLQLRTNSTFNSTRCATQKAPPKSLQDLNGSCTKTEWPSSTHELRCGHATKNGRVNRFPPQRVLLGRGDSYNCRILGKDKPHVTYELERGSPKVNVCAGLVQKLIRLLYFSNKAVTGRSNLDLLELCTLSQLPPYTMLQQDGVPPHFCHHVRIHLNREMARRLIGRGGPVA